MLTESFAVPIGVTDTSYQIASITPGTTYNLTVSFVNEVGESINNTVGELYYDKFLYCTYRNFYNSGIGGEKRFCLES